MNQPSTAIVATAASIFPNMSENPLFDIGPAFHAHLSKQNLISGLPDETVEAVEIEIIANSGAAV